VKNKFLLIVLFLFSGFFGWGQPKKAYFDGLKPYLAKIITKDSTVKGIFLKIDSQNVVVFSKGRYTKINTTDIKSIKLKITKPGYELQSYLFKYVEKKEYNYLNQQGKRVDEWGRGEPSFDDDVAGVIGGVILEGITNIVVGSLHNINPNVASYRFKNGFDMAQLESLSYYSIYYQQHPNTLAELKKIKELSVGFKP